MVPESPSFWNLHCNLDFTFTASQNVFWGPGFSGLLEPCHRLYGSLTAAFHMPVKPGLGGWIQLQSSTTSHPLSPPHTPSYLLPATPAWIRASVCLCRWVWENIFKGQFNLIRELLWQHSQLRGSPFKCISVSSYWNHQVGRALPLRHLSYCLRAENQASL